MDRSLIVRMVGLVLEAKNITPKFTDVVNDAKETITKYMPDLSSEEVDKLAREIATEVIEAYNVKIDISHVIEEDDGDEWFETEKNRQGHKNSYAMRYSIYLSQKGFANSAIKRIMEDNEKILSRCANPRTKNLKLAKKKGLVVGEVQSGKTANYVGLINMACDYNYEVILVLAGLTNPLRVQTQQRIDEGFVGALSNTINSSNISFVGVGNLDNEKDTSAKKIFAVPLTNLDNDFNTGAKDNNNATKSDYNKPIIIVAKKCKSVLTNIAQWLKPGTGNGIKADNILIIDDEADNASVNTKKDTESPSVINKLIRQIFNNFTIASYVGYTATPFANVFIDPYDDGAFEDLFPKNFIIQLEAPGTYFGAKTVFKKNNDRYEHIRIVDTTEKYFLPVVHKITTPFLGLCDSLKESILVFIINNCIRTLRNDGTKHRTMMINISRLNQMQDKINYYVEEYVDKVVTQVKQYINMGPEVYLKQEEINKMYDLYQDDDFYSNIRNEFSWDEVVSVMISEVNKLKTIVFNARNVKNRYSYDEDKEEGARVIAIGGFVLSRGLTLEGLMVSYYSRSGSAYDTLMQMSRWFGYRNKYDDLCRIYMSQSSLDYFNAVMEANDDLRTQFIRMEELKKTPKDFGLMVKESPDTLDTKLLVTARNKMKNSTEIVRSLNYSGRAYGTSKLFLSNAINNSNWECVYKLINEEAKRGKYLQNINGRNMICGASKSNIVKLLDGIKIPIQNRKFNTAFLKDAIINSDKLYSWDVVIATGEGNEWSLNGEVYKAALRRFDYRDNEDFVRISGSNNSLSEPGIFNSGMDKDDLEIVRKEAEKYGRKTPSANDYLRVKAKSNKNNNPLLVIYPVTLKPEDIDDRIRDVVSEDKPYIGFSIGIPGEPGDGNSVVVKYLANKIYEESYNDDSYDYFLDEDEEVVEDE